MTCQGFPARLILNLSGEEMKSCGLAACSFILCGQGSSLLWTPALRPYRSPVHLPRERKGIGRCVRCMLASVGCRRDLVV